LNGKRLLFKYSNRKIRDAKEEPKVDIGAYFVILQYVMTIATFAALVLIFLYMLFGKDEKEE
jgi:hypothetical protein